MGTVKHFVKGMIWVIFSLIPLSAVVALIVWFIGQVVFGLSLGGFVNTWKWSYIIMLMLDWVLDIISMASMLSKLKAYANKIGLPLNEVETAWWDMRFHKTDKDMFEWDANTFRHKVEIYKLARSLAKGMTEALFGKD